MEKKYEDYIEEINKLCLTCRKAKKCQDHTKVCVSKKLLWCMAKKVYNIRVKKGLIKE